MNYEEEQQNQAMRLAALEARMNRMEAMMQQLLGILTTSIADSVGQHQQLNQLLQGLHSSPNLQMGGTAGFTPEAVPPQQERPEIRAIREAVQAGDRKKALQLSRSLNKGGAQESQAAIEDM